MEENKITISKYDYDKLKEISLKYDILISYILHADSTSLSYDKKDLSLSASTVNKALKAIEPVWYNEVLDKYKAKEEENNNDTN